MVRYTSCVLAALIAGLAVARADDGLRLKRGANPSDVSISGVSSGAAMAVEYAVAHSQSIGAVGTIAGPPWGCADGRLSLATNTCMCGRETVEPKTDAARQMAASGKIDSLSSLGKPQALKRSYLFHSPADATVAVQSGRANAAFLSAFTGEDAKVDWGNSADGSDQAGHGIIAPDSNNESCQLNGLETTYVRRCGAEDNVGKMFHALYDAPGSAFDPSKRVNDIPETEVWQFSQKQLIERVTAGSVVAPDLAWFSWPWPWWTYSSPRRQNLDMAENGYIYVPPSCRALGSSCRVHIALHGCKQNPHDFAMKAGYNNWAGHYKVIIVYPAIKPSIPLSEAICQLPPVDSSIDELPYKPNPNGCWDWWGYLDTSNQKDRYLTKDAPQMLVLGAIIAEVTSR
jgi:hypothetical protein